MKKICIIISLITIGFGLSFYTPRYFSSGKNVISESPKKTEGGLNNTSVSEENQTNKTNCNWDYAQEKNNTLEVFVIDGLWSRNYDTCFGLYYSVNNNILDWAEEHRESTGNDVLIYTYTLSDLNSLEASNAIISKTYNHKSLDEFLYKPEKRFEWESDFYNLADKYIAEDSFYSIYGERYSDFKNRILNKGWEIVRSSDTEIEPGIPHGFDCRGQGYDSFCSVQFKRNDVYRHVNIRKRESSGYEEWTVVGNQ